jgi:hypothetical protein
MKKKMALKDQKKKTFVKQINGNFGNIDSSDENK